MDALLDTVEQLQAAALPASELEREIFAARVEGYSPLDLDALAAAGEVVWVGVEPLGERDGRIALYLTDHLPRLWRPPALAADDLSERERGVVAVLRTRGASFFGDLHAAAGGGYPGQTLDVLWDLVFKGLVMNDLFCPLRAFTLPKEARGRRSIGAAGSFRSRREAPPSGEGRWSLIESRIAEPGTGTGTDTGTDTDTDTDTDTARGAVMAQQLLSRCGVVTREVALASPCRVVSDRCTKSSRPWRKGIRRGFLASDVGAVQFALPPVVDMLRSLRGTLSGRRW